MTLIEGYADQVRRLAGYAPAAGRHLSVDLVVNPVAGFFRSRASLRRLMQRLEATLRTLSATQPHRGPGSVRIHYTRYSGHARQLTTERLRTHTSGDHWIIAAGGDGTAREICTALVQAARVPPGVRLFRFPLGTGNDAADAPDIDSAHAALLGAGGVAMAPALEICGATGPARYAFNVASFGLDAYVADLTNRAKRFVPGEAYKAFVNLGAALYPAVVPQAPTRVWRSDGSLLWAGVPTMLAFGVTGQRTYGGGMRILPGVHNACLVRRMSLPRKMRSAPAFYRGQHVAMPEVSMASFTQLQVGSEVGLPLQLDGEVCWLAAEEFPLTLQVRPDCLPLLCGPGPRPADGSRSVGVPGRS